ncbi:MAG: cysteine hydrolase [Actinomycetota bacterium]|jgi:nicotinamidase-related amidase|nr:cysteine hydrolase [Actinomycetota bacterium]
MMATGGGGRFVGNGEGRGVALLVIDVQNAMVQAAHRGEELLENVGLLLAEARRAGAPVVFVQHDGGEDYEPMMPGRSGWEIHERVAPRQGEPVIRKQESDSFYDTALEEELRSHGIGRVVVAGMSSEACVDTTCRSALSRGYVVTLAGDAHTTVNDAVLAMMGREEVSAAQIVAHHNDVLGSLSSPDRIGVKPAASIVFDGQGATRRADTASDGIARI